MQIKKNKPFGKKTLIGTLVVAVIIIALVWSHLSTGKEAIAVTLTQVKKQAVDASVLASGSLVYREHVDLRPQVIGKVIDVPVKEGETVKKGDIIVRIDPETFKAEVASQKANVSMAQIAIKQQKLTIDNLKSDWTRKKKLYDKGLIDAASYDDATNKLAIARTQLATRKQQLTLNQAQLSKAQEQLQQTVVKAPLNGIVTNIDVKPGETVIAGTKNMVSSAMMTIADPSQMYAELRVDEADIAHIALGQAATVTAVAYPNHPISGKVTFISTSASQATDQSNLSFEVKVLLSHKDTVDLRPGMSCRAEIHTQSSHNTIAAPVQAVFYPSQSRAKATRDTAQGYVYVVKDQHVKKQTVKTGISNASTIVIMNGLNVGDTIVTGPYRALQKLQPGDAVTSLKKAPHDFPRH